MNIWIEKTIVNGQQHKITGDRAMGKVLWSPRTGSDGRDTYKNMRLVMPGDMVLHFVDNTSIAGVSIVENSAIETDGLAGTAWDKPAYLIKLKNYTELNPHVKRSSLLNDKNKAVLQSIAENSEVFYNNNLNLRQGGYLTPCTTELLDLINDIYKERSKVNLPFIDEIGITNDPIKTLIENYIKRITVNQLKDEVYKWELVSTYNGRPNTDAPDFYQEIKDIKFSNLIYAMAMAVINQLANERPEEIRQLFINLYDETKNLTERVKSFNKETLKIYRDLGETLQHHQDERSIATYLTFHNAEKYTFYKSSFYKKYCKLLGVKEAKKNEKYVHYLKLINDLIENYIVPDKELIEQVKSLIPAYYDGSNHNILAQDILFQMLDQKDQVNYWVFQGNPKVFDFETALKKELVTDWSVSAHKDKIKVGDKVILWITGDNSGCYALAEVTSEPHERTSSPDDHLWQEEDKSELKADVKITHNLVDSPILKESIDSLEELKDLKVGNQGTNFSATEEEYKTILDITLSNDNSIYSTVRKVLDQEKLDKFISFLRNYVKHNKLEPTDKRISFNVRPNKNRLAFIIGNRYSLSIQKVKSKTEFSFISKNILSKKSGHFTNHKGEIEAYWNEVEDLEGFEENIKEGFKIELLRNNNSPFRRFTNQDFINDIYQTDINMNEKTNKSFKSLNTILYGPPGTGKTYRLREKYFERFTISESSLTKEQFILNLVSDLTWWQTFAIALYDSGKTSLNHLLEHEIVQAKASLSNAKNIRPIAWSRMQAHAVPECPHVNVADSSEPSLFYKEVDSEWRVVTEKVESLYPEGVEILEHIKNFQLNEDKTIKNYEFVTFHQSFGYEDFVEGIKPKLEEGNSTLEYEIKEGIFKKLCQRAEQDPQNNYAIFIDEINRGNVSAIFGELITLIEDDKRIGKPQELRLKLPYSKTEFGVPANLYIIGTMNTADRSVEALDTALRRRFSFQEIMPDINVIANEKVEDINLSEVLKTLNSRIELLVDRDHTIGHSYFINVNSKKLLANAFSDKIIPLLQEYFYGDYGKIGLVLGKGFVEKLNNSKIDFASFDYEGQNDFKTPTFVLKKVNEDSIVEAVNLLLSNKENKQEN